MENIKSIIEESILVKNELKEYLIEDINDVINTILECYKNKKSSS